MLSEGSPLGRHFGQCGSENLSLQIIDCGIERNEEAIRQIDGVWQNRVACFVQHGGNINIRDEM